MRPGGFVSHKPIRRLAMTGKSLGGYTRLSYGTSLSGFGGPGFVSNKAIRRVAHPGRGLGDSSSYVLNPSQMNDLINRNPAVAALLNSGNPPPSGSWSIGYQFTDAVYGNVLISQAFDGTWYFDANSPIATSVVNAPPYQSPENPPGTSSCTDSVADFLGCVESSGSILLLAVGGYLLYRAFK